MLPIALELALVAWLPGALLFRLPCWHRERRAALAFDERLFWQVVLSLAWSLAVVLGLSALNAYRFDRLLLVNAAGSGLLLAAARGALRYQGTAPRADWTVVLPLALIGLGLWRFFPPSEYIIGGKDPGTYMNQGIQIAQRGTMTIYEPIVAGVPDYARDLFFPRYPREEYYSIRFMGFFLRDPRTGATNGQFPQLFPASIAIGYGVHGLTGARWATGVWAILGLLAVYFAAARFVGKPAAASAAALLSLHVVQVWFARYPNSEMALQPLVFAALLAFARAHQDGDRFFGPVAGALVGLMLFTRVEALPLLVGLLGAGLLVWLVQRTALRAGFLVALVVSGAAALPYYEGPTRPYTQRLFVFFDTLPPGSTAAAIAGLVLAVAVLFWMRRRFAERAQRLVPLVLAIGLLGLAAYGALLREPGGRLAVYDAHALRTFTQLYLLWPGLVAAAAGIALVVPRQFWRDPAFVLIFAGLSVLIFYKMRIPPVEFWAARRWVPVILPGALVFAAAAAFGPGRRLRWIRGAAGGGVLAFLAYGYAARAAPVLPHVEYAGMIPALEQLAAAFADRDLVLVESRNAGADTHVLAVPLAYVYARNVLVLNSPRPDKLQLRLFLQHAQTVYSRIFFVGGGGTDLLSRHITARAVADATLKVPEFEEVPSTDGRLPAASRRKDFDYSVYELTLGAGAAGPFTLDVGSRDDLHVLRFNAKESTEGRTIRWTAPRSVVAVPGMTGREREVELVMHNGGRPAQAPPARVEVYLNDALLGAVDVGAGFRPYRFAIPPPVAAAAAGAEDPAQLTLVSSVWSPRQFLGGADDRRLGVMLDRVEVR